ncbi:MAG: hypothetical protein JWN32_4503 [Solirubrobacterales bacterium]|nr:hypothetical protein [Solirubrobacterales bacterium]
MTIARIASGGYDVVGRRELLAVGVTATEIRHRLAVKRLRLLYPGVYAVGSAPLSRLGRFHAAVLACGDGALLSHRSAAALHGLRPGAETYVEVTIPRIGSRRRRGIVVHGTRSLPLEEVADVHGVPCTSVARTLVDLATVINERQLARALEQSLILRTFDRVAVSATLQRANGRRGASALRLLVAQSTDAPTNVRSDFERRVLALVRKHGLPEPITNGLVCGHEVDFHWPEHRLVVEADGRETHDTPIAFERDRARDLDLELAGWHVLRISWRQLEYEPGRVLALLRARLYDSRSQ